MENDYKTLAGNLSQCGICRRLMLPDENFYVTAAGELCCFGCGLSAKDVRPKSPITPEFAIAPEIPAPWLDAIKNLPVQELDPAALGSDQVDAPTANSILREWHPTKREWFAGMIMAGGNYDSGPHIVEMADEIIRLLEEKK